VVNGPNIFQMLLVNNIVIHIRIFLHRLKFGSPQAAGLSYVDKSTKLRQKHTACRSTDADENIVVCNVYNGFKLKFHGTDTDTDTDTSPTPRADPRRAHFLARMSVGDARVYACTCTVHDKR